MMSLSKELDLINDSLNSLSLNERKEDNYRRDSFDDRFCDDLCEDILQYLSLEDKLRLECVSKQFQRTVFQRQYKLNLKEAIFSMPQIFEALAKKFQRVDCLRKLKSISIALTESDLRQILPQLKAFPALKRLKISDYTYGNLNELFSFEAFEGLSNITHLTLRFDGMIKETILKDIDINLPNLKYLKFENIFEVSPEGVTQMADILSRLSRLQTLNLKIKRKNSDLLVNQFKTIFN